MKRILLGAFVSLLLSLTFLADSVANDFSREMVTASLPDNNHRFDPPFPTAFNNHKVYYSWHSGLYLKSDSKPYPKGTFGVDPYFPPGGLLKLTQDPLGWSAASISYAQFQAANPVLLQSASVTYQDFNYDGVADFHVLLGPTYDDVAMQVIPANNSYTRYKVVLVGPPTSSLPSYAQTGGTTNDVPLVQPVYNKFSSHAIGSLNGEASVSGGQANYGIPITLPPGRAKMQPRVAISYNSQSGNGLLGNGFSLAAGESISRCSRTVAQDGVSASFNYSTNDPICLNGSRLVLVSGNQGQAGSVYKTEIDQFLIVKLLGGNLNSSQSYFNVTYKNGAQKVFGSNGNTAEVVLRNKTKTLTWLIKTAADATAKNFIHYDYESRGAGEVLLSNIFYTGNSSTARGNRSVEFEYIDRDDKRSGYSFGGFYETTSLLSNIKTKVDNDVIFTYSLNYRKSRASNRSILDSIEQCGEIECFQPTVFEWQDNPFTYELDRLRVNEQEVLTDKRRISEAMPYGDINGDGAVDWPGYFIDADKKGGAHNFILDRCVTSSLTLKNQCVSGDFNNDGLTDGWVVTSGQKLQLKVTQGQTITTNIPMPVSSLTPSENSHIKDIRDYNGDGYVDLVVYVFDSNAIKLKLYSHTKNVNAPYNANNVKTIYTYSAQGSYPNRSVLTNISFIGDIDGNGFPDMIESDLQSNNVTSLRPIARPLNQLLNNGSTFVSSAMPFATINGDIESSFYSQFIDVNGDGLLDWLGYKNQTTGQTVVSVNLGGGNFGPKQAIAMQFPLRSYRNYDQQSGDWVVKRYPKYANAMKVQDINMDGIPELLMPGERLLEACARVGINQVIKCGDDLYGAIKMSPTSNDTSPIPSEKLDNSVYRYDAYSFSSDHNGNITATFIQNTGIVGNAYESAMVDAYGDGFTDMVFALGVKDVASDCPTQSDGFYLDHANATGVMAGRDCEYGVYVNRSKGSASGEQAYAATDVLISVTNGFGTTDSWEYSPLSSSEATGAADLPLYAVDTRDVNDADHFHFSSSMYVVKRMSTDNGLNGTFDTSYAYRGAMYNNKGRGFRGFRTIVVENENLGIVTQTDFRQKFPFSSTVQGSHTFTSSHYAGALQSATGQLMTVLDYDYEKSNEGNSLNFGNAISSSTQTWQRNLAHWSANNSGDCSLVWNSELQERDLYCSSGNFIYSIYQESDSTITRDLVDPTIIVSSGSSLVSAADIDAFGNVTRATQTATDIYGTKSVTIESGFINIDNFTNWRIGRKTAQKTFVNKVVGRNTTDPYLLSNRQDLDSDFWVKKVFTDFHPSNQPQLVITSTSQSESMARPNVQTFVYNEYGLPIRVSVTADVLNNSNVWVEETRASSIEYSNNNLTVGADGYFPFKLTNALNHISYIHTNKAFGTESKTVDANGITTVTLYDDFGRISSIKAAGSPIASQYIDSANSDTNSPENGQWMIVTTSAGVPEKRVYFDYLGRELRSSTQGFNGDWINVDTAYDAQGFKIEESMPFGGVQNSSYRYGNFDELGRPGHKIMPNGLRVDYSYFGLTTDIEASTNTMQRTYSGKALMSTVDALGGVTKYAYSASGQPIIIEDVNGSRIYAKYNALGQKTKVEDPNQGTTLYAYNGFGELETELTANSEIISHNYDKLGRVISKKVTSNSTTLSSFVYQYDTTLKGAPYRETADNVIRTYDYDRGNGRLIGKTLYIDGLTFDTQYRYDSGYGRLKGTQYANDIVLENQYNEYGYMTKLLNAQSKYAYKTVHSMDNFQNVTHATLGSGVVERASYNQRTGQATYINATSGSNAFHNLDYYGGYDEFGNLETERNLATNTNNSFAYDDLHRLTSSTYNSAFISLTYDYDYDASGNLIKKSDYANTYRYGNEGRNLGGNAGRSAVRQVVKNNGATVNFTYDNVGNMKTGDGMSIDYNAFKQPTRIRRNSTTFQFQYDANLQRVKETRGLISTYEVDRVFEKSSDGTWSFYIGDSAVLKHTGDDNYTLLYRHKDRLGSALTFSDETGQLKGRRSFDPFGKPRSVSNPNDSYSRLTFINDLDKGGRRGFTDHRHLDEAELIHMNGRVYDYNLGRFMSVDPFVHGGSQGINPYSYILNNPLAGTDPSGYAPVKSTHRVSRPHSRISRKVTASTTTSADGKTASIHLEGGTAADQNALTSAILGPISPAASNSSGVQNAVDIGSPSSVATNNQSQSSSTSGGDSGDSYTVSDGGTSMTPNYRGATAEFTDITTNDEGVVTNATITCNLSCQKESLDILSGRDLAKADLSMTMMRMNMQSAQRQAFVATGVATAAPYVIAQPFIFYGGLTATQKLVVFLSADIAISQANAFSNFKKGKGFDVSSLGQKTITEARSLKGRMRIPAKLGDKIEDEN